MLGYYNHSSNKTFFNVKEKVFGHLFDVFSETSVVFDEIFLSLTFPILSLILWLMFYRLRLLMIFPDIFPGFPSHFL